ncbi:error-prone DNA polymerase, partial [Alloacidobacterium sp.]|uniref:DNA polymerase III subunit alpha n=1 Tax=Alloacidobacterium sp. TaxID=2951999 RepID=UPI002D6734DC
MTDYIELHARSAFSFLEGASLPESLMARAADLGMPAMALLDRNGVYGAPRFHTTAQKLGTRAHIGAEITASDLGQRLRPPAYLPHQHPVEPVRLPLLVKSRTGYQNLCRLITRFKMRESTKAEGAAVERDVEQYSKGLVCLTGGDEGPLAAALSNGGSEAALKTVEKLVGIFGQKNVYVELQRHFSREEEYRNRAAVDIARSLNLPLLATGGVSHATAYEREVMDVFTCIRHKKTLDTAGRMLAINAERHLRSAAEMKQLFYDYPEAIANTKELSSRLQFEMNDLGYQFPAYPVPEGQTMDSFLRQRVDEGIRSRYLPKSNPGLYAKAKKQAERELRLIEQLGLAGYFLIVWDIVQFCKRNGVLVQGRGSAANSVVCYALEITAIDPVGMNLLFERFLSEERGEWPDIDIDLPSDTDRERAIQYVYQSYGELGAAMTANVTTYRGRSASREAGKVLGFDHDTLGRLTALVGAWEWKGPNDTLENSFRAASFDVQHPRIAKYLELCERMQDLPRNLSQHSGGMVICQGHLDAVVPLERASMPGRTVVQWDKEDCSDMKIIKVDLLGLGMMAVMKDCVELVPRHYGRPLDLAQLPQDPEVYKTLQRADTVGMFQVESRAQMSALPRNKPEKFYDLVVQVAIIRPGPIVGKMMNPYMLRRQGKQEITYPHPLLEPVLKRTLGVPLFQEQLIRIAMVVANFTGGEAEELRRAVGMRRSKDRMKALEVKLRNGMTANSVAPEAQEQIVQAISSFALYGFPESHAASFALIAYASAYIKQHYLAAFTCAMLNNQPMGFYSPSTLINDARRHGLKVLSIDVQHSDWQCTLEDLNNTERSKYSDPFALRRGFRYVKGLRQQTGEGIASARKTDGPFASEYDLQRRVPEIRKAELTLLARVGALNWTGEKHHRRTALWRAERAGQPVGPLFENVPDAYEADTSVPLAAMTTEERLVADFKLTGATNDKHPLSFHRQHLNNLGISKAADLRNMPDGVYARTAGCVIARQRPGTAKGFVFLSLEDESGISNAIIHPDLYERNRVVVTS